MRFCSKKIPCFAVMLACLAAGSLAQSLGDVAREQKQKRQAKDPQTASKVITNDDVPEHPDDDTSAAQLPPHQNAPTRPLGSKSAAQWKTEIATQRNQVTSLQNQIDRLNASIHFAPPTCVRNCVPYNERQVHKQDEVQRLQGQLENAKTKMEEMQESARREGFGNAVWEP